MQGTVGCACWLPGCVACDGEQPSRQQTQAATGSRQQMHIKGNQASQQVPGLSHCLCFRPDCRACHPPEDNRDNRRLTASGVTLTPEQKRVVNFVYRELFHMLEQEHSPAHSAAKFLAKGPDWTNLIVEGDGFGSRLENLVAKLCHCGVRAVQGACRDVAGAEAQCVAIPESLPRGRQPKPRASPPPPEKTLCIPDNAVAIMQDTEDIHGIGNVSRPWVSRAGVLGTFLPSAEKSPQSHAIAVVHGRLLLWGIVHGIPYRTLLGVSAQLALAHAPVAQKYQGWATRSIFSGIAAGLCQDVCCARFWRSPPNLPHPSAWRLSFDGVTIKNGSTC